MIHPVVELRDLTALMGSPAQDPVLYLDGNSQLAVWAAAYVSHDRVVLTQAQLVELTGSPCGGDPAALWDSLKEIRRVVLEQLQDEAAEDIERILSAED